MDSALLNNKEEFYNLMIKHQYWTNPNYDPDKDTRCTKPDHYPCIVVHHWSRPWSGRERELLEFIYLDDFGYDKCKQYLEDNKELYEPETYTSQPLEQDHVNRL